MLQVPGQAVALEAVEERHEAGGPVRVVEVDGVDPLGPERGGAPLGPLLHALEAGRVDQLHLGVERPEGDQRGDVGTAQPEAGEQRRVLGLHRADGRAARRPGRRCRSRRGCRGRKGARSSLSVGIEAGSADFGTAAIGRWRPRRRTTPSWSRTGTPSAVSQRSVSSPVAPSRSARAKASSVFSGACGPGATVREADGGVEERRIAGGHAACSHGAQRPDAGRPDAAAAGRSGRGRTDGRGVGSVDSASCSPSSTAWAGER